MAGQTAQITIPSDNNYHNILTLLQGVTGLTPTNGILDNMAYYFTVEASFNNSANISIAGSNFANSDGIVISPGGYLPPVVSSRKTINLNDYNVKGNGQTISVIWEY
jgi:hypothetical protein